MTTASYIETTLGPLYLEVSEIGLRRLQFISTEPARAANVVENDLPVYKKQLAEYFAGSRRTFDLPLDISGSEFQKEVWQALTEVPYGQTASYADIAKMIKRPLAFRAVGQANNKNPVAIIIPCHRIIGKNGSYTGYAAGLENKQWLLEHEKRNKNI